MILHGRQLPRLAFGSQQSIASAALSGSCAKFNSCALCQQMAKSGSMPTRRITLAERNAILASGQPFVVSPKEVVKCMPAYDSDPEIILGCIIVSGTLDTAEVLRAEQHLNYGLATTDAQREAHAAFRRVWSSPTSAERVEVLALAKRLCGGKARAFRWTPSN